MRRLAVVLAVGAVALAGCGGGGGGDKKERTDKTEQRDKPDERAIGKKAEKGKDVVEDAMKQIRESDMPADVKKELEEAKKLLDEQAGG